MSYVIITPSDSGIITHERVSLNDINIPDDAETFDSKEKYESRLNELQ